MRKAAFSALLLFVFATFVFAQEPGYTITQSIFLPPQYYVGDIVELRLRLQLEEGLYIEEPEQMPQAAWLDFHSISIEPRGDEFEVRIRFAPYYPGIRSLPAIDLGEITLSGIRIQTASLLEETGHDFAPPHGQLLLPSTKLFIGIIIGTISAIIAAGLFGWTWGRKKIHSAIQRYIAGRPYRRISKVMDVLRNQLSEMNSRSFYITLSDSFRTYLTEKLKENYLTATTSEIERTIRKKLPENVSSKEIVHILAYADMVKFANKRAAAATRQKHLAITSKLIEKLEGKTQSQNNKKGDKHVDT
ncbi:MAG: hypothetical protein ACLFR1_04555 [Spirochaetia bacterium]